MRRTAGTAAALAALTLLGSSILTGCGTEKSESSRRGAAALTGVRWTPERVTHDGRTYSALPGSRLTFREDRAEGSLCNDFSSDITIDGTKLTVGKTVATKRGCRAEDGKGDHPFEEQFLAVFTGELDIVLTPDGKSLSLNGKGDDSLALSAPQPTPEATASPPDPDAPTGN
ncbi:MULTISPECIES: META domain-containing protein [Streptomyces]|uniref:DUF306 domain-containing protein n=1 Tax=Streptomyces albus (strain ATCC 21838 / DSM 41398 / FERM P-419 / JCM 4703 / NBRC 107858) TaxID=1081613 RepID=A0A0B5EQ51_STRA4|nr:META domain-containing protein [Streptomyces sp. SCSIO ZS0520]AJE81405.1 hypothetical protein SLNWT_1029 [Streptomyces albus]AOU75721.1 hypothetical protein SLNHY_1030 [Streptomyces albus]AYN31522.1 hypothetical protein DUI70_1019 [Streptomyces albus]